jgi:hypothetical protein
MTLKKNLIAAAVGSALTVGLAAQPANADLGAFMLFPYVVKDANRTTVVTIIGNGQAVNAGANMHLQYWTKSTTDANTAACQPNSTTLTFTANDIVSFDTAALLGAGPLFGDTTNSAPLGTSISYTAPRHGYLLVRNNVITPINLYAGYWTELDLANGGAHGDHALRNSSDDFFSSAEPNTDLFSGGFSDARAVQFLPTSVASTVFTVTPIGTAMDTIENNQTIMQVFNTTGVQGAYDRNENGVDGTVPQTVRCVGRLTAAQLMPGVVANAAWAATGGWGWLANTNITTSTEAHVHQVETSTAAGAGKFMSNATRIATDDL